MVVIDRNRCCGCGKCASMIILLPNLGSKDMYEFYQDPVGPDVDFVENIMQDCWAGCIFYHKNIL